MGNCISKINKDRSFVYEEYLKSKTPLGKGKTRRALDVDTRGGTYMEAHSLLRFTEIMTLAPLQTGAW